MNNQEVNFPHLSSFIKRCSKQLQLTRDDLVRATGMCSDMASAVWNGKNIRLSYYIQACRLLFLRSFNPRYKLTPTEFLKGLTEAISKELEEPP